MLAGLSPEKYDMERVHVVDVKDDSSPPPPPRVRRRRDEVQVAVADTEGREVRGLSPTRQLEAERAVETDGAPHIVGGQGHGADRSEARVAHAAF